MRPASLRFRSLRTKLLAAFVLVILVPTLATAIYGYLITGRVLSEQAINTSVQEVNLQAEHMVRSLAQAQGDALYLSRLRSLGMMRDQRAASDEQALWRDEAEQDFMVLLSVRPMYRNLRFVDNAGQEVIHVVSDGRRVASAETPAGVSAQTHAADALAAPVGSVVVSPFTQGGETEPVVHYALRMDDGVLMIDILAGWILRNLPSSTQGVWALTDQDLNYLVYPDGMDGAGGAADSAAFEGLLGEGAGTFETDTDVIVYNTIVPSASDPTRFWVLFQQTPRTVLYAGVTDFYQKAAAAFGLAVVLAAGVALLVAEGIVGPVRRLTWMAEAFGHGGKAPVAPTDLPDDEIGVLTDAFCDMALELERKRDEAKMLFERLITAQEEERKLVAYDLHDGLIQQLVGARFYLTTSREQAPDSDNAQNSFRLGLDALCEAIVEGRRIIEGLRPSALDDLGLEAALQDLAESTAHAAGWELNLDLGKLPAEPEKTVGVTLYRVAQEALNNARKHAGAHHVRLSMANGNGISLRIEDDGVGFDATLIGQHGRGLGITTMSERVALLKGTYTIQSTPEAGTVVSLWVPWDPPKQLAAGEPNKGASDGSQL